MKRNTRSHSIDTVFVLVVFSTFALSVLMVLALGAGVYRNINDISREFEAERTALSYVRTKVRNLDNAGAFQVAPLGDIPALHISENIGGTEYTTVIYSYDGWLCELFSESSLEFAPQDGIRIAPVTDLHFEQQDDKTITISASDMFILLSPRSSSAAEGSGG